MCADVPADQTGYTYSDGRPAPCSALSSNCGSVSALCPETCNACGGVTQRWTKPYERKNFEISSECTSTERSKLIAADALKDDMCADMLYCMKEKTATCQSQVTKWFGGSVSDTSQWDTLYQGFARICSSNNYKYNCRPTGCKISFTYGGTRYNDAEQTSIPANVRDAFIQQCQTSGCGYSATIAYVYSNRVNEREQNLCPIGFWLQKDYHDVNGLGSKATTIVHELSHFVDLAGTDDLSYSPQEHLSAAQSNPWQYLDNAATWYVFF